MEKFEIHVTGTDNIIRVLERLGYKWLHAEMRDRENRTVGVEFMSSFVKEFENYAACKEWVDGFVMTLQDEGVTIFRVKIECPYNYSHYSESSVYLEAHFPYTDNTYPFVYNVRADKYVGTDRTYAKPGYADMIAKWQSVPGSEIELCLYDDNIIHDYEWLNKYEIRQAE